MNKPDLFRKMIDRDVWGALTEVYGIKALDPTENQVKLVESIAGRLYIRFGSKFTVKELSEFMEESWIDNHELPDFIQKD